MRCILQITAIRLLRLDLELVISLRGLRRLSVFVVELVSLGSCTRARSYAVSSNR